MFSLSQPEAADRIRRLACALGLVLSGAMVFRSQVGGDQLNLLARGWLLAARGELVPYGNPMSLGGNGPGIATSLLVGAPIAVWANHRAPVVLLWLLHLIAWILVDRRLRTVLSPWERAALAVVYWLNPWRLTASAFLWNPNFLFFAAALHFTTAFDSRERPQWLSSMLHVLALGVGAQLHPAMLLLIVASILLWLRGAWRVHWGGIFLGAVAILAMLVPWWEAVAHAPAIVSVAHGFPFRGLLWVQPWLKGLSYWLRYPSLLIDRQNIAFDFSALVGARADRLLVPAARGLVLAAGALSLPPVLVANVEFLRRRFSAGVRLACARTKTADARSFLDDYAFWCLVAAVLVFAAAPTTPQSWQAVPLFLAALLPFVFWLGRRLAGANDGTSAPAGPVLRSPLVARRWLMAAIVSAVGLELAIAGGAPSFRCGGRDAVGFPQRSWSPMFDELGLNRTCRWELDVPGKWWPDVLPEETKPETMARPDGPHAFRSSARRSP
ncbi:MAG: hypothetical protein ABI639_06680 [Thermoanaerobaculia bacterium]